MTRRFLTIAMVIVLNLLPLGGVFAEETVGCPHDVGKGKFKIRAKVSYIKATKCYSDEVWKALHGGSPYLIDHNKMVDLPEEWHQKLTNIVLGLEYGIIDRLSVGVFIPYVLKDLKRQVWSNEENEPIWKEVDDNGFQDMWFSAKYLVYSESPGLFGLDWQDGLFFAVGYKPSISSDEKIKNGIGSGTNDFKFVVLSHPHFTKNFFLCSDIGYQYRGKVKAIDGFNKSEWDMGDKFAYRAFLGYEFPGQKFVIVGGPQGWIAETDTDKDGNECEDSNKYSHGITVKFRWMPFGDEDAGSIDIGVRVPYANKTPFAASYIPNVSARIKF